MPPLFRITTISGSYPDFNEKIETGKVNPGTQQRLVQGTRHPDR